MTNGEYKKYWAVFNADGSVFAFSFDIPGDASQDDAERFYIARGYNISDSAYRAELERFKADGKRVEQAYLVPANQYVDRNLQEIFRQRIQDRETEIENLKNRFNHLYPDIVSWGRRPDEVFSLVVSSRAQDREIVGYIEYLETVSRTDFHAAKHWRDVSLVKSEQVQAKDAELIRLWEKHLQQNSELAIKKLELSQAAEEIKRLNVELVEAKNANRN